VQKHILFYQIDVIGVTDFLKCKFQSINLKSQNSYKSNLKGVQRLSWSWSYGSWICNKYAISAYHHWCCEFELHSWRGVVDTTLCDKVCQWLATGRWLSPGPLVSSTNKTDRHDITEILLKVALNTIKQTNIKDVLYLHMSNPYTISYHFQPIRQLSSVQTFGSNK